MNKVFLVELTVTVAIVADSEVNALVYAENNSSEILNNEIDNVSSGYSFEIESIDDLNCNSFANGWSGEDVPYGGDGNTKLKDLLPENKPFKDTKTQDMFAA